MSWDAHSMNYSLKVFKEFLHKNGCYRKFVDNLEPSDSEYKKYQNFEVKLKYSEPDDFIICSFVWSKTPQGSDYWNEINNKWLDKLEQIEKTKVG